MPTSVLITCHDAGGTVPPVLALTEASVARGDRVVVLSQPSVGERAEAAGATFVAFSDVPDYERGRALEEQLERTVPVLTGRTIGDDVVATAAQHGVDVLVVDANLAGGLAAAETLDQPSAVLLHSMYATFVDTWFGDIWPLVEPLVNDTRRHYGLPPTGGWPEVFAPHDRMLAVVPSTFDAPTAQPPATMRHFGFLVPSGAPSTGTTRTAGTAGMAGTGFPPGDHPAVLVGLSTTYQRQDDLLASIVEALGRLPVRGLVTTAGQVDLDRLPRPSNVTVTDFVPHGAVLGETDVMVTHAGLGSVAAALAAGVPLVCTPIGRDQHLNGERVAAHGAGVTLGEDRGAAEIAAAVEDVLAERHYRDAARALAEASRQEGGAAALTADLAGLVTRQ